MSPVCRASRRRALVAALSVVGHGALIAGLISGRPNAISVMAEQPVITVVLALPQVPPPPPDPEPPMPVKSAERQESPRPHQPTARTAKASIMAPTLLAGEAERTTGPGAAQLIGAATAGSGRGEGAGCNMLRRLQEALRKDRRVQAAVGEADKGSALMVWNGNWVRHPGQEGAGLAAVREAILWEVGFAPPECQLETVKGLVVVTLSDSPGAARLALGSGSWRWRDLLFVGARGVRP